MKRTASIFLAVCFCGIGFLQAQELPFPVQPEPQIFFPPNFRSAIYKPAKLHFTPAFPLQPQRPLEEDWEKRIEVQKTALKRILPTAQSRNLRVEIKMWGGVNTGNYVNNWSSFPDRMLDARTLSMPLPSRLMDKFPVKQ